MDTLVNKSIIDLPNEIWKDIPNYEGKYKVSNLGRIKTLSRKRVKLGIKIPYKSNNGYLRADLYNDGIAKKYLVHQLVAMAYLGHDKNNNKNLIVDHINNIKTDNRLSNLQIITQRENILKKDRSKFLSKYIGVSFISSRKRWLAKISYNGKRIHLGTFKVDLDAHKCYMKALDSIKKGKFDEFILDHKKSN